MKNCKVMEALGAAINNRVVAYNIAWVLVWDQDKIRCVPRFRLRTPMILLADLTERECNEGCMSDKWDRIIGRTIRIIKAHRKESDYE